jgi:probable HAF family extracellular repeat protein
MRNFWDPIGPGKYQPYSATIGGVDAPTYATGVAANGGNDLQVVGYFTRLINGISVNHGFLKTTGSISISMELTDPNASATGFTQPNAVNENGDIVGTYYVNNGSTQGTLGFLRTGNGAWSDLSDPNGRFGTTVPLGINNAGKIVGYYTGFDNHTHGFIYDHGSWTTVSSPSGSDTYLTGINNKGLEVGYWNSGLGSFSTGFIYNGVGFTDITDYGGKVFTTQFNSINDAGQVAGTWGKEGVEALRGFVMTMSPNPAPPAGTTAYMLLNQGYNYEIYDLGGNAIKAAYSVDQIDSGWTFAGTGHFGKNHFDTIFRDGAGNFLDVNFADNNVIAYHNIGKVGLDWKTGGFGNFNGDSYTDMMLRNAATGGLEAYNIADNTIIGAAFMGTVGLDWKITGFGDFYNHGHDDMIMRNANSGGLYAYDISGNRINSANYMGIVGTDWQTLGFGNFSGRGGNGDMIMQNTKTGGLEVYDINHGQITGAAFMGAVGLDWKFAGIAPVHGAGESDLVLRNVTTGMFEVYDISHNALVGAAPLGAIGSDWDFDALATDLNLFSGAGGSSGAAVSSQSVNLLTQAMSSFDASGSSGDLGAVAPQETSQQPVLTTPQHG